MHTRAPNEIIGLIGVSRVARNYDELNVLSRDQNMKRIVTRDKKYPEYNTLDVCGARDHGADAMVFLWSMCLDALSSEYRARVLEIEMIRDVCRFVLGEDLAWNGKTV